MNRDERDIVKEDKSVETPERVWFACRAGGGCEGKWATVNMKFPQDSQGGRTIRYVCETCKRPFHVRY